MLLRYMKHYYLNIVNVLSDLAPLNSLCVCVLSFPTCYEL